MSNGFYHLYLDESTYHDENRNQIYGVCGVVVGDSELTKVRREMGDLKKELWKGHMPYSSAKNVILHATEIRQANKSNRSIKNRSYEIFKANHKVKKVFEGIGGIVKNHELPIIGCILNLNDISTNYCIKTDNYRGDAICMNTIIDNYICFLKNNNGKGDIIFESRHDGSKRDSLADRRLRKQFYKRMVYGTTHYQAFEIQECLESISFRRKQENEAGLQIADFVIQPFLFNFANQKQNTPNIYQTLRKHRYGGGNVLGGKNAGKHGVFYVK